MMRSIKIIRKKKNNIKLWVTVDKACSYVHPCFHVCLVSLLSAGLSCTKRSLASELEVLRQHSSGPGLEKKGLRHQ